ncbi:MAG: glycoside hydrolase family 11 protein [Spirochaetales bacterium]|nr:glycoside hydrolase family 11 protein [Spirochaetales bacterium]
MFEEGIRVGDAVRGAGGETRATNYYQCWVGGNGGGVNCTDNGNGRYSGNWNTSNDFVVGTGWNPCNSRNIQWTGGCSGSGSSPISLAEHFQGWQSLGKSIGGQNYCIVASEAWQGSGTFDVTVSENTGSGSKTWQALGSGTNDYVYALTCNANTLYAGGYFSSPGNHVAAYK